MAGPGTAEGCLGPGTAEASMAIGRAVTSAGPEGPYEVIHERVIVRGEPSTRGVAVSVVKRGDRVGGAPFVVGGSPWLRLDEETLELRGIMLPKGVEGCWLMIDGKTVGLGRLLKPLTAPAQAVEGRAPGSAGAGASGPEASAQTASKGSDQNGSAQVVPTGPRSEYIVSHQKVVRRSGPTTDATPLKVSVKGELVKGVPCRVNGQAWLQLDSGWMLMDGASVGLGELLRPATNIAEDVVRWAEEHRATEAGKGITWTAETEDELRRLETTARLQVAPLREWCEHDLVLRQLEEAGFIRPQEFTLGADGVADNILRALLRRRAGLLVLGEEPLEDGLPWSEDSFSCFLKHKVTPSAPFFCRLFLPDDPPQRLLVLFHGSLVQGDDLVAEAEILRKLMPETAVVLPEAPVVVEQHHGLRLWWPPEHDAPAKDFGEAQSRGDLAAPTVTLQRTVATLRWAAGRFKGAAMIVGGFSQGAMLAAQCVTHLVGEARCPCRGLLLLSGLVAPVDLGQPRQVRCLAVHGDADERIPVAVARQAAEKAAEAGDGGFALEVVTGMGHEISDAVVDYVVRFCDEVAPVARVVARCDDPECVQEANQAKLLRWVKNISKVITMFDDARFMSHMMHLDMVRFDGADPSLGGGLLRYRLHRANGGPSRGLVVVFHGKVRHLGQDTKNLVDAYKKLRLDVCVVDYRPKFSQFCVDATIVLEELGSLSADKAGPVIVHACGCGAIHGLHMLIASHSYPRALRRRLRLLVLDGAVANFRSLPPSPTGCIATDPIGNDEKLKYVGVPLCIFGGDDACCGLALKTTGHFTVLTKAAETLLDEGNLSALVTNPGTALMADAGETRLCPELFTAASEALEMATQSGEQTTHRFIQDVLGSNIEGSASEFEEEDLLQICEAVLDAARAEGVAQQHWWRIRALREPQQGEELVKFIVGCHEAALQKHGGFEPGLAGLRQFEGALAAQPALADAREKVRAAFDLRQRDGDIERLAKEPAALGVSLDRCHECLDSALVSWSSRELWDRAVGQVWAAGGSTASARRTVKEISADMNVARARRLGIRGNPIEVDSQLSSMFDFWRQHDPSCSQKMNDVMTAVMVFNGALVAHFKAQQPQAKAPVRDAAPAVPAGEHVEVAVEHAVEGGCVTVSVPGTALVSDVRRAIMAALRETKLSQVKLVTRSAGTFQTLPDDQQLGERRSLLMFGCSIAGARGESPVPASGLPEEPLAAPPAKCKEEVAAGVPQPSEDSNAEIHVLVHIDRALGLQAPLTLPARAFVRAVKEQLAQADPTGSARPEDFSLRLPGGDKLLQDDEPLNGATAEVEVCLPDSV